jgi:hypothetical protein
MVKNLVILQILFHINSHFKSIDLFLGVKFCLLKSYNVPW